MIDPRPLAALSGALALTLSLSACATSQAGAYPSLEQRPAERVSGTLQPTPPSAEPAPPPAPSADLASRLAALEGDARSAHAAFTRAAPAAERLAIAAGATGTDSWAAAQVALADLDSLRSSAAIALSDVDILFIDAAVGGGNAAAIAVVRQSIEALVAEEDRILARLRGRL